ncbi:MAG: ion transporter [Planctomycetaceae bacterium]|nr:ion transporter [Planctomycetaceae bacterium]
MWRLILQRIFCSEPVVIAAILLNAAVVTWTYFPDFHGNTALMALDKFLTIFFVCEAVTKIGLLGSRQYFGTGMHRLDFALVIISLPSLLIGVIDIPDTSFLLLFRILRLLRLLRFLQFIPNIDHLLSGLVRALKASLLVLIFLAFFNFILAIVTCHFYGKLAPELFGDPLLSMFTIFQLFTVEGWNEIPTEINAAIKAANLEWYMLDGYGLMALTRFYFGTVVLFGGIFGLSLANAVFVDEMTIDNNDTIDHKMDELQVQLASIQRQLSETRELLEQNRR